MDKQKPKKDRQPDIPKNQNHPNKNKTDVSSKKSKLFTSKQSSAESDWNYMYE